MSEGEDRADEDRGGNEYLLALGVTCMRFVRSLREKLGMPEDFHMRAKIPSPSSTQAGWRYRPYQKISVQQCNIYLICPVSQVTFS